MQDNRILVRTKRRRQMTVCREVEDLEALMGELPGELCEHKIISFCRISTAAFLRWVADHAHIYRMSLATFRVGPRALRLLSAMRGQGQLDEARFVLGRMAASHHRGNNEREYWGRLVELCSRYGWRACSIANHTKLALFDTDRGRFVLEGSANLNETPNWEQYTFQQDDELYGFFDQVFDEMFAFAAREGDQAEIPEAEDDLDGKEGLEWPDRDRPPLW